MRLLGVVRYSKNLASFLIKSYCHQFSFNLPSFCSRDDWIMADCFRGQNILPFIKPIVSWHSMNTVYKWNKVAYQIGFHRSISIWPCIGLPTIESENMGLKKWTCSETKARSRERDAEGDKGERNRERIPPFPQEWWDVGVVDWVEVQTCILPSKCHCHYLLLH